MATTYYLGLGSNLGNRTEALEAALFGIGKFASVVKVSSLVETPALLPPHAPTEWNRPFFNLVAKVESDLEPTAFLKRALEIESKLGRVRSGKWSPRTIDIDLLHAETGGVAIAFSGSELILPHPEIFSREFVLDPLAEIAPELKINGKSIKECAKFHPKHQTRLMGILNITPDSFSDGGKFSLASELKENLPALLDRWDAIGISAIDVGGESTRPNATPLDPENEWLRLMCTLHILKNRYENKKIRPKISVDTRHALTAKRSLDFGVDIINDVNGLRDPEMVQVLRNSKCEIVLMHSLSVPPQKTEVLPEDCDPVETIKTIWDAKLRELEKEGIARSRIWLDPGIGFGKTSLQSLVILRRIAEFESLGCQILSGHSRKSFIQDFAGAEAKDRDAETLGLSFELCRKGVECLRVHDPVLHHRAFLAGRQIS